MRNAQGILRRNADCGFDHYQKGACETAPGDVTNYRIGPGKGMIRRAPLLESTEVIAPISAFRFTPVRFPITRSPLAESTQLSLSLAKMMKYQSVFHEHTIGAEASKRYASRGRRANALRRPNSAARAEPSRKPRDAAELLAKIDAIYQELSLQPLPPSRRTESKPRAAQRWPVGLTLIGIVVFALAAGEVWLYSDRHTVVKRTPQEVEALAAHVTAEAPRSVPAAPPVSVLPSPALIEAPPAPPDASSEMFDTLKKARAKAAKKAERRRRAAEELVAARRAWEAAEQARYREEAAKRVAPPPQDAPAPRRPQSPQEVCAGQGNFFSRNFCEARICQQGDWRDHPYCVRRNANPMGNG